MNEKQLENILIEEIPLEGLAIDSGIYEFYQDGGHKSMGISYERNEDGKEVYVFNVFWNDQYINVDGEYESIYDCIPELLKVWNEV